MDYIYKAMISHDDKTIQALYRTQYYAYEKNKIIIRFAIGLALIIAAVSLSLPIWGRAPLLLMGTWIVSTPDFPAQVRADKVLQTRKDNLPSMSYEFYDDRINISGEGSMNISYKELTKLIYDKKYFYIFITKKSVCMIDKKTILNNDIENFMTFIENKTGMRWHTQKSILAMTIHDILDL